MSDFMRGHGRVPFKPMPRRGFVVVERVVMGVVATTRVSVIVLVGGFIGAVSETGSAEDGGDIYS